MTIPPPPPPSPPPPPPPRSKPALFDQDDEPEPDRETVRIITYRDAIHIRQDLAREQMAWKVFWRTIAFGTMLIILGVVAWWAYTEFFRSGVIEPYNDPEPPATFPIIGPAE